MNSDRTVFRPSAVFLLCWLFGATFCLAWTLALALNLCRQHGRHWGAVLSYMLTRGLALELVFCGCFGAVFGFVLARLFPVVVSREGIHGHNVMGGRASVRWAEIEAIRPFSLLGLRYLRIFPRAPARPLWVPLFLEDRDGFRATVRRFATAGNAVLTGW